MDTITVLCNPAMIELLAPLRQSKPYPSDYGFGSVRIVAEYDEAALKALDEDSVNAAGAWWRGLGPANIEVPYDEDAIRIQGVESYLCERCGISTEKNMAIGLWELAYAAGKDPIAFMDWCVDVQPQREASNQVG